MTMKRYTCIVAIRCNQLNSHVIGINFLNIHVFTFNISIVSMLNVCCGLIICSLIFDSLDIWSRNKTKIPNKDLSRNRPWLINCIKPLSWKQVCWLSIQGIDLYALDSYKVLFFMQGLIQLGLKESHW